MDERNSDDLMSDITASMENIRDCMDGMRHVLGKAAGGIEVLLPNEDLDGLEMWRDVLCVVSDEIQSTVWNAECEVENRGLA